MPGSGEILSTEGATQGDPLAMVMYAIAVTPIIHHLRSFFQIIQQVWYADDAAGAGSCDKVKMWWDELNRIDPLYGYIILMHPRLASLLNHGVMNMLLMKSLLARG